MLLTSILSTFLSILGSNDTAATRQMIISYMTEFPKVQRFKIIMMFLGEDEGRLTRDLVSTLGGVDVVGKQWSV